MTNIVAWAATFLFATGRLGWGTILALAVGILDGLDGKQARVKIETTKAGKLEHWFDALLRTFLVDCDCLSSAKLRHGYPALSFILCF